MKKVVIGGFISIIGSVWALAFGLLAANNLVSSWSTPPGRFVTTLTELDVMPYFVISIILVLLGLIIMGIEYFKKD